MTTPELSTIGGFQYYVETEAPFTVHIWGGHNADPNGPESHLQPHDCTKEGNPDWANFEDAQAWAIQTITELENPQPRPSGIPSPQEIQAAQTILAASGFTVTAPTN